MTQEDVHQRRKSCIAAVNDTLNNLIINCNYFGSDPSCCEVHNEPEITENRLCKLLNQRFFAIFCLIVV